MKKLISLFLILTVLVNMFYFPVSASNKTLRQLLVDLNNLEQELIEKSDEKKLTEEKLKEITNKITEVGLKINDIEENIIQIQKDIENMNETITSKEKEIKNLVNLFQKNDNENLYLEFLFGSDDLTSFIYRMKAIEQITAYNDKLIDDLHKIIEEIKEKEKDLNKEKEELEKENEILGQEQQELGLKMNVLDEDARDLLEDMAAAKTAINNYQQMGCNMDDTLESCSVIPSDTAFLRPLTSGVVTSGYGVRDNPVTGGYQFHAAVDIGGNTPGTSVYASANGVVVLAYYTPNPNVPNSSCGGNFVVVQHQINGKYYASRYMHLSKIYVQSGQKVSQNDIIGAVGGGEAYDRCSTGPHLDFSVASGIYGKDFYLFRQPNTINPYTLLNLPARGVYFTGRYQKY